MTIIVGLRHSTGVLIGGDSLEVVAKTLQKTVREDSKVVRNRGFVFGMTGRFRIAQVLGEYPDFSRPPTSNIETWIVETFIPQMQDAFDRARWWPEEGGLLVGFESFLLQIMFEDWQYKLSADDYDAIGSGGGPALGALFATQTECPAERLWLALEAAGHHNAGVSGAPFVIHNTAAPWCPTGWRNRNEFVRAFRSGVGTPARWSMRSPQPSIWDGGAGEEY